MTKNLYHWIYMNKLSGLQSRCWDYIYLWTKEGRQPLNNKIVSIWRNLLILVRIQLYWTPEKIYYINTHLPMYFDITCIFCQYVIALHYLPMGQLLELTKKKNSIIAFACLSCVKICMQVCGLKLFEIHTSCYVASLS